MTLVITFSGIFLLILIVMARAAQQPNKKSGRPVGAEWLAEMSMERYKPMLRLLDPADSKFLADQPGCTPAMIRRLRDQRCHDFARFVAALSSDFDRAMLFAAAVAAQKGGRPELPSVCARAGRQFAQRRFVVQFRLALYRRFGVGSVQGDRLLALFERVGVELHLAGIAAKSQEFGFQISTSHFHRPSSCLQ